jgi:hypothetical protein
MEPFAAATQNATMSDIADLIYDFLSDLPKSMMLDLLVFVVPYATDDFSAFSAEHDFDRNETKDTLLRKAK